MSPRFPIFSSSSSDARTAALQGLLIATIVIAGLYFGREVLLPLALAGTSFPAEAEGSAAHRCGDRRRLGLRRYLRAWVAHVATGDTARRGVTPLSARARRKNRFAS